MSNDLILGVVDPVTLATVIANLITTILGYVFGKKRAQRKAKEKQLE